MVEWLEEELGEILFERGSNYFEVAVNAMLIMKKATFVWTRICFSNAFRLSGPTRVFPDGRWAAWAGSCPGR